MLSTSAGGTGLKRGERMEMLDPADIMFSYRKVSERFSGCAETLQETLDEVLDGTVCPKTDIPVIAGVEWVDKQSGKYMVASLNNRRLWVFKAARDAGKVQTVPVRIKSREECERLVAKGSHTFRVDRCTLGPATLIRERPAKPAKPAAVSDDTTATAQEEEKPVQAVPQDTGKAYVAEPQPQQHVKEEEDWGEEDNTRSKRKGKKKKKKKT